MRITLDTAELRPATIAAMIADLLDNPTLINVPAVKRLMAQLENTVGDEESIEWLVEVGVTPEQIAPKGLPLEERKVDRAAALPSPRRELPIEPDGDIIYA